MKNKGISFRTVEFRKIYVGISVLMVLLSVALIIFRGFNLGIDFESGLSLSFRIGKGDVQIDDVRSSLSDIHGIRVQNIGDMDDGRFQIRSMISEGQDQRSMENMISSRLERSFGEVTLLESNFIGAKFSSSLVTGSLKAVAIALVLILIYVWVRFRAAYAIGSIIALIHDVTLLLGFISLVRYEISSTTIAAILTIIGYSLNNTIVIFDRIRESIASDRTQPVSQVIDFGVNSSLTRTTYSSVTTLLAVIPLAVLSSGDVRSFAVCMIFGVTVGTYSSNFLATNILYGLGRLPSMDIMREEKTDDMSDEAMAARILDEDDDSKWK